jgi:glycerate 2-kinase
MFALKYDIIISIESILFSGSSSITMANIKNRNTLVGESEIRKDALDILESAYDAISTEKILKGRISLDSGEICIDDGRYTCANYENIYFLGIGKCALEGARVIEDVLGDRLTEGVVIDVSQGELKKIRSYKGTHPLPSEDNVIATKEAVSMLEKATERDLVLVLVSGGGSALMCLPYQVSVETLISITSELTKAGADIYELNTVRKHLSMVKGGQLSKLAYPAEVVSLIFSDVLGDDISVIASGPTIRDTSSVSDAEKILERYDILKKIGTRNLSLIETPKDEKYFTKTRNVLVVSNANALQAMKAKAIELGYETQILTDKLSGEAREVGVYFAKTEPANKRCIIAGGETTVTIKGSGKGGRNQEAVLASLPYLPEGRVFISVASDGCDNTDVAGALGDSEVYASSLKAGLSVESFLEENNSYDFFRKAGGHIETGLTGSNVSDLLLLLDL